MSQPQRMHAVRCRRCGCLGNCSCKHQPYDRMKCCALDAAEICPCCRAISKWERCDICGEPHEPNNCPRFITIDQL